ncbi:MAG: small multi-drug export protein [Verrucomicrobiales bacterium]
MPVTWAVTLFGPFVLTLVLLASLYVAHGPGYVSKLIGTALATFFFFGRFVILGGADPELEELQQFLSPEFLFTMVVYMDAMVAMMFVFHAAFLFKIPWIGPRLRDLANDGHFILKKNPWMRRAAVLGLVAFVAFPLAATGSVGGAILSRILGLPRLRAFFAIVAGSLVGCGMMYFGSQLINRYLPRDSSWTTIGGVVVIAGIIVFLNVWYRRLKEREEGLESGRAHPAVPATHPK